MKTKELFIIRGLPGSGKSTLAKSLGGKHVEADMYHLDKDGNYSWKPEKVKEAHAWCQNQVMNWMIELEERIVVSNTFTQEWELKTYLEWAEDFGYKVFSLIVENRHGGKNIHNVPEEVLDKMRERFEVVI
jgi:tRNA uridine 5-carbamoylmethylation protein Kti12